MTMFHFENTKYMKMQHHNCVGQCVDGDGKRQKFEETSLMKVEIGKIILSTWL